ncbi:MAG: ABC transporter ATP-binding protein [Alphaproteobacteria bacterium]
MVAPLLAARGLDAFYGRAQILFDVDLDVAAGEAVVLLGRNGAGKTTTLRALMGLVPARWGELRLDDEPIAGAEPTHRIARRGIGWVPEDRRLFGELTVAENLEVGRRPPPPGRTAWTPPALFQLFPNLAGLQRRRARYMSGGEQQMLAIARTLMGNPRLVLLDEPSEGLAPGIVRDLAHAVVAMKRAGVGLLLCEQNLGFARTVADRAYVIEGGRVRWSGTMAALQADDATRRRWLAV